MAFLGSFFAITFLFFRIENYDLKFNEFLVMFVTGSIGCLIGSKLLYFLTMLPSQNDFSLTNLIILFLQSGYVFYGGLFGTLIALRLFSKYAKKDVDSIYQLTTPALPLFHGFGRVGCFLAGCCYGVTLNEPVDFMNIIRFYILPTQLIESLFEFILFAILFCLSKKIHKPNLLKLYLLSYSIFRFTIEFFRDDPDRGIWFGLSTSQWISLFILIYYSLKWLKNKYKNVK